MRGRLGMALALCIALALLAAAMAFTATGWMRATARRTASEPDPMFAEPAETVTQPPSLSDEATAAPGTEGDDPSERWVYATLTPIGTPER